MTIKCKLIKKLEIVLTLKATQALVLKNYIQNISEEDADPDNTLLELFQALPEFHVLNQQIHEEETI